MKSGNINFDETRSLKEMVELENAATPKKKKGAQQRRRTVSNFSTRVREKERGMQ